MEKTYTIGEILHKMKKVSTQMEETFANGENIHKIEKSYTKSKIYKNGENSHKMEKTDTKWRKQTQNGENRHKMEKTDTKWRKQIPTGDRYQIKFQISGLWAILGTNTHQVLIPPRTKSLSRLVGKVIQRFKFLCWIYFTRPIHKEICT